MELESIVSTTPVSRVKTGRFIGYCKACELMLMEGDVTCPRCEAVVAIPMGGGTADGHNEVLT